MSSGLSPEIDPQMRDDFFGEADEHLEGIRQRLLKLDEISGRTGQEIGLIRELFQDFHSLKGICAIVGLRPAEAIAHATEDLLRLVRDGKAQVTGNGLAALTRATRRIEECVAAFREQTSLPEHESILASLRHECEEWSSAAAPGFNALATSTHEPALAAAIEEAKAAGGQLLKCTFAPTRELDARGVNIDSVREALSAEGLRILSTNSIVRGKGELVFEFVVIHRGSPAVLTRLETMGIELAPVEAAAATAEGESVPDPGVVHSPFLAPSQIVRVDLKRLDDLMRIAGEMVIHRSRLDAELAKLRASAGPVDLAGIQEVNGGLGRSLRDLREAIMRVRLIPVSEIFARMHFVVRDLARVAEKKIRLKVSGQETAIDKYVIERLKDPLLHLVRNACSHGIETPADRVAASKPEEGVIELSAESVGESVVITIKDDGRGIDVDAIVQRARELGMDVPESLDSSGLLAILCSSGFSTRRDADLASGRGVGMAVVQSTVRELGGTLSLTSEPGRGTQFNIRLPLTLTIAETLIVRSAGQICALPQSAVREILETTEKDIQTVNRIEIVPYRDGVLPIVRLADFFRLPSSARSKLCLLVVVSDRGSVGLVAEEVLGQREVVVRPLRDPLIQVPGISGATELGDGKPVLILDGAALMTGAVSPPGCHWEVGANN